MSTRESIDPTMSVNETICRYPSALDVLPRRGIDTCCGGDLPLATAAAEAGVDLPLLLREIADVAPDRREAAQ